jgi:hypothetical protein
MLRGAAPSETRQGAALRRAREPHPALIVPPEDIKPGLLGLAISPFLKPWSRALLARPFVAYYLIRRRRISLYAYFAGAVWILLPMIQLLFYFLLWGLSPHQTIHFWIGTIVFDLVVGLPITMAFVIPAVTSQVRTTADDLDQLLLCPNVTTTDIVHGCTLPAAALHNLGVLLSTFLAITFLIIMTIGAQISELQYNIFGIPVILFAYILRTKALMAFGMHVAAMTARSALFVSPKEHYLYAIRDCLTKNAILQILLVIAILYSPCLPLIVAFFCAFFLEDNAISTMKVTAEHQGAWFNFRDNDSAPRSDSPLTDWMRNRRGHHHARLP